MNDIEAKPANCPCCDAPMRGKVLVCETCWFLSHPKDRTTFRRIFMQQRANKAAWSSIAAKIIRTIKEKLSSK